MALGTVRFGPITPEHESRIKAIDDLTRLEALGIRLLTVNLGRTVSGPGPGRLTTFALSPAWELKLFSPLAHGAASVPTGFGPPQGGWGRMPRSS